MKIRNFYLNIGSDKIFFMSILFNGDTGVATDGLSANIFKSLSVSPTVIDISNLGYLPREGDLWNGTDFVNSEGQVSILSHPAQQIETAKFCFVINNINQLYLAFAVDEQHEMIIAALRSNPKISYEDENA